MADAISPSPNLPHPTPDEAAALALAATYLKRASTETSSRLLRLPTIQGDGLLLLALRDTLFSASVLCADLAQPGRDA